ncbi:response regulator [Stigmatella sp. ncwal1]|uniref:histidine kinase n=1 Tax=Stigmatella ashevillensis TaxID=2995309 RepID=A0ABT5DCE2_9BACT|nr:ATP-binding protein [Stigmatella ashevillena]MDC0711344.1 response regulator [Stigmatella ashevillena]
MHVGQESRATILVVDDQPFELAALERSLGSLDLHIIKAQSGEEALQYLEDQEFALVLMDVRMPGMDGFEAARLIREHAPNRRVPLIFLSGARREEAVIVRGYASGAVDYLSKPVEPDALRAKVRVFVDLFHEREALRRQEQTLSQRERQVLERQRRQAEEALLESQRTLSMLMGNLPGMVFRCRPDWSLDFASEGCQALTGYAASDFASSPSLWTSLMAPEDVERIVQEAKQAFVEGRLVTAVYRILRRDAQPRWMWARSAGVFSPEGELRFIEGFMTDITEAKAAESERDRLLVGLREAVRQRDEFLAVASHELKTPLTSLSLRVQVMRKEVDAQPRGDPKERLHKHLDAAGAQLGRLASLVDSLLDTTRIISGRLSLRREQGVNLAGIVRAVASGFETQAMRVGSPLEIDAPVRVLGHWDALRLEQVVTNLLSNALKFGAGRAVQLWVEERGEWARLRVSDQGIGMDEDVRARLFGRFERGVSDRHYGGLGLGLFITRQVVEAMGGQVLVQSEPGQGATFTVELPRLPPAGESEGALDEH